MTNIKPAHTSFVVFLGLILLSSSLSFSQTSESRKDAGCGSVSVRYNPPSEGEGSLLIITKVENVSCDKARRVVSVCVNQKRVRGWTVKKVKQPSTDGSDWYLVNRNQRITFGGGAGGNPSCVPQD